MAIDRFDGDCKGPHVVVRTGDRRGDSCGRAIRRGQQPSAGGKQTAQNKVVKRWWQAKERSRPDCEVRPAVFNREVEIRYFLAVLALADLAAGAAFLTSVFFAAGFFAAAISVAPLGRVGHLIPKLSSLFGTRTRETTQKCDTPTRDVNFISDLPSNQRVRSYCHLKNRSSRKCCSARDCRNSFTHNFECFTLSLRRNSSRHHRPDQSGPLLREVDSEQVVPKIQIAINAQVSSASQALPVWGISRFVAMAREKGFAGPGAFAMSGQLCRCHSTSRVHSVA